MPKRALLERRPFLLASLAAAIAYYLLKDARFPGGYLMVIEAASVLLLALYALLRHGSGHARMIAGAMALGAIGVVALELHVYIGTLALVAGLGLLIGVFIQNRRETASGSQKIAATALLLLTPLIAWFMAAGHPAQATAATFGLAVGGMAASAWVSVFPRYRVGAGATFYVASSLISIAGMGPLGDSEAGNLLAWPLFYLGHFLICTGAIQTLRGDRAARED